MSGQKKIWMVRLGDHICGPFETCELEGFIEDQQITEIDEVALPCKGWEYVRDRGEFLSVLEKVRTNSFNKAGVGTGTPATSVSRTENITKIEEEDRTQEVGAGSTADDTKTLPLVDFNGLDIEKKEEERPQKFNTPQLVNKKRNAPLIALCVFLFSGGLYFLFSQGVVSSKIMKTASQKDFNLAWASGDYDKSLQILKGSSNLKNKNKLQYAAALLMKRVEFSGVDKVLSSSQDKTSTRWKNLKGLSSHYAKNLDVAESEYLSVLEKDPDYVPSLVNLGVLHRNAGEWAESRSYFESAFAKEDSKGFDLVGFYLLESWMRQSLADSGLLKLDSVNAYLQNQMVGDSTYKHEFKLVELWIGTLRRKWDKTEEELLRSLLELDPGILTKRVVSPYVYRLQPGALSYLCDDLDQKLKRSVYKAPVVGLCAIVDQKYEKADRILKGASQSEYVLALRSFVKRVQGEEEKAQEFLSKAMEIRADKNPTKFFLQARFCFRKGDMKCSAEYFMKALDRNPESYTALTGLGQSYFQVGDFEKAQSFAKRSAEFVSSYGPLIDLQTRLKEVK